MSHTHRVASIVTISNDKSTEEVMPITLSQKVTNLLTTLGENIPNFKKRAQEMADTPGKSYFKVTLNKAEYYMRTRKNGADTEVYDYGFDKPKG
jgi:hypothetical protein